MISHNTSWIPIPEDSDFSIYNIPFGIFSDSDTTKRVGVAIGEFIIDLSVAYEYGIFDDLNIDKSVFKRDYLNDFISLGKRVTSKVRIIIQKELMNANSVLKNYPTPLISQENAIMHLPVYIRDYTDFYSSIEHATNVGKMFRDPANALLPNWKHIPVGYHGRASSIIVSGVDIHRPKGQVLPPGKSTPIYTASSRIDFELEMGYIIGKETELGKKLNTKNAENYIFGKVLFNDWSARDIQKWEYIPLGPFLAKNFASSISPWVVTMEALEYFRVEGPEQDVPVLPYLEFEGARNYDIKLEVALQPKAEEETIISKSNFKYMYWNMAQQLAHHTMNGCNLNVGDMMGSGTISGKSPDSYGSMLELSWAGEKPIKLKGGDIRTFINDNDTVIMRGYCIKDNKRIGFGEVSTKLLPAKSR
ncbi:fumarylacetoacetase [uncultured Maribacter sp.]|uniref:fumarylacetoacetase n=1 Tax=uncultured Maribacter sp. TaxID=431308 RepID=UPI00263419C1|nr:fumarylacetoacetase [uncultured Maribacter sp.]